MVRFGPPASRGGSGEGGGGGGGGEGAGREDYSAVAALGVPILCEDPAPASFNRCIPPPQWPRESASSPYPQPPLPAPPPETEAGGGEAERRGGGERAEGRG